MVNGGGAKPAAFCAMEEQLVIPNKPTPSNLTPFFKISSRRGIRAINTPSDVENDQSSPPQSVASIPLTDCGKTSDKSPRPRSARTSPRAGCCVVRPGGAHIPPRSDSKTGPPASLLVKSESAGVHFHPVPPFGGGAQR